MRRRRFLAAAAAVAAAPPILARQAHAAVFINVLTGGSSGVYYPLGIALANLFNETIPDANASAQATKASVENLNLLQAGDGELAFTLADAASLAWAGDEEVGYARPLDRLRHVAAIYPNYIQVVATAESGITSLADLRGKRVSVGAPKSGTELNARAIFGAAGLSYDDLGKVEYLPFAESVELMKNRQLDATLQSAGLGVASIRDLASSIAIVVVEVPEDLIAKIGAPFQSAPIPAGTYQGQEAAVNTAIVPNYLVTRSDLSEDLVYEMTKQMFENLGQLAAAHAAAKQVRLEDAAKGSPVPIHPGAAKYFKEKNVAM